MPRKITIKWSKQFEFNGVVGNNHAPKESDANGLYMLLENYGQGFRKELIYIGIVKSNQRSLLQRLKEHRDDWLGKIADRRVWVKFGKIQGTEKVDPYLIEDIESALIFGALPRENTAKKQSYHSYYDVIVTNKSHDGFLRPTYSTADQRKRGE